MSIDRREDAGDFYPGGKVISTRPVATGGDVKHSDFAGLDVKTNTIPDLRDAVRELGRRLGATVVTALSACVAVAATVQTVPVNDLDFDANPSIVTNVVFDAPPDFSTNNMELVETIEATAPAPGDYAAVSNAAVYAATTNALQDVAIESNRVNIASNRVAISTLSDTKLDKSGGTVMGGIYFSAQGTYGYLSLAYDGENHRLIITDGWHENLAYLEVPNAYDGDRVAFTHDIDAAISTLSDSISSLSTNVDAKLDKSGNDFTVSHTADGLRIADNAGVYSIDVAPNRVRTNFPDEQPHDVVWPQLGGTLALTSDIPDVPAAIENTVTTAYVREKLGAWMEYDEATGLYYYCHEEE